MSVAFRRDSDEEHLEPKFEIPIPPGPNLVTPRGLAQIEAKVAAWEALVLTIAEEEPRKKAQRDLRYWRTRLATAQLMPVPDGQSVAIGCTVTFSHNGKERTLSIVGDDEAEPASGLISFTAPLSRALMGAQPGDLLSFAGKEDVIELLEINVT